MFALGVLLAVVSSIVVGLPMAQVQSLVSLYNSTSGSSWTFGWNISEPDPCNPLWKGITCNATDNGVLTISLSNNLLVGELPELELPDLTFL